MPKPHEFLSAEQRDGSTLQAEEIYTETWEWLKKVGCAAKVSPQLLEQPIPSPFINIGINYMNQAVRLWNESLYPLPSWCPM